MARVIDKNLGDVVKQLRASGLSYRNIATKLKISVGTAYNLGQDEISPQETTPNNEMHNNSPALNTEMHHPTTISKRKTKSTYVNEYSKKPLYYRNYNTPSWILQAGDLYNNAKAPHLRRQMESDYYNRERARFNQEHKERMEAIENNSKVGEEIDKLKLDLIVADKQRRRKTAIINIEQDINILKNDPHYSPQKQKNENKQPTLEKHETDIQCINEYTKEKQGEPINIPEKIISIDQKKDYGIQDKLIKKSEETLESPVEQDDKLNSTDLSYWILIGFFSLCSSYIETRRNITKRENSKLNKKKMKKPIPIAIPIAKVVEQIKPVDNKPKKITLRLADD